MEVTPETIVANLTSVRERLAAAHAALAPDARLPAPTLIAVSKTKPTPLLQAAYDAGQRDFGENYVQEVVEKAPALPPDVRWHFIGHLQTNKVKDLVAVPNLFCVHTVDSLKLANELQKRTAALRPDRPLEVMVQVNTSAEESKSGCAPTECLALCSELVASCPLLSLRGLMCIGKYSSAEGVADEDFACLVACRQQVAAMLKLDPSTLALSMGMSHDFEVATRAGSTHVRVGSTIFGARQPKLPTA
ncbi:hypothetical protein AB1Y20_001207 [Prymnesium parvum]|uniref:Pyridoxal phosphate homeostasis protein n=1 Tax=Prymnesium parvum TaxID=97485 RepID=A0AB34KBV9_PRYPA